MGHVIFTIDTQVFQKSVINLKDKMKFDLCIYEALNYKYDTMETICGCGYELPLISFKLIFENSSSKAEQKTAVAHYQTFYTNSTEVTVH